MSKRKDYLIALYIVINYVSKPGAEKPEMSVCVSATIPTNSFDAEVGDEVIVSGMSILIQSKIPSEQIEDATHFAGVAENIYDLDDFNDIVEHFINRGWKTEDFLDEYNR